MRVACAYCVCGVVASQLFFVSAGAGDGSAALLLIIPRVDVSWAVYADPAAGNERVKFGYGA